MTEESEEKTATRWNVLSDEGAMRDYRKLDMSGLDLMHLYYNRLVTGDPNRHYLVHFKDTYLKSGTPRIASLGSGSGHLERTLVNFGFPYESIDGFELSPALVKYSNDEASKLGLSQLKYREMNLNQPLLPKCHYDLAIFFHSLHHIDNLESCLNTVATSLKDNGLLLVVDFVGPNRFQWTDHQVQLAQELLDLLPDGLKVDLSQKTEKKIKAKIHRPTVEEVTSTDPSEAIRPEDIRSALQTDFDVIEDKPLGGTLLNLLFEKIAGNFDENDPLIRTLIHMLQKHEETLIRTGVIPSDFVFMVLKKKTRN